MATDNAAKEESAPDFCPHCGARLSPWQKVLLSVDRALMCRKCWYRIIMDRYEPEAGGEHSSENRK